MHTIQYYTAIKMSKLLLDAATQVKLTQKNVERKKPDIKE